MKQQCNRISRNKFYDFIIDSFNIILKIYLLLINLKNKNFDIQ